ncbi:GntR family transcriptional regulator [Cellvibrio sp. pealriver]|uniref:GntR family transcriptional regulator n=1 Tax=Cellvibrio sp. pealriver TaxID=1622269 RepID=UPI00066FDE3F|nr:GntR family transcriptional regulator [Cellvibrio sp. pealriver]
MMALVDTELAFSVLLGREQGLVEQILADIALGTFVSGNRLVTAQLAERYGTGVNPVREALKQLEGEGFVTSQKNSGARVASFEYTSMRDLFEILQLLEPYFMAWFVDHYSDENVAQLDQLLQQMRGLTANDRVGFLHLDNLFHWEMYRHHYNKNALKIWKTKRLMLLAMHGNLAVSRTRIEHSISEHQQIIEALRAGKGAQSVQALALHLSSSEDYWSKLIR